MVIRITDSPARRRGWLMVELLAAKKLLLGALIPIAYSIASEKRLAHSYYQRAVAMEIVDGELDVLAAGGQLLGRAAYSPSSQIRARLWTFDPSEPVDADFFAKKSLPRWTGARS